ncbi:protein-export chaperone SecB [Solirhodobacter olei]|uniref:protein-export chaperone SecB n=1 Tax=Solirhodobacter olei TaxID=2493082 RepID=UPI000FD94BE8|nr:protein-export chaperone SecB [Solirhodobacter olei]
MSDNGAEAEGQQVQMQILAQFIRDISFENVLAQKGIQGDQVTPDIQVQVSLDARRRPVDNQFEVISKYRVESKNQDSGEMLFLLELEYSGIFHVEGIPDDQLHPFLLIECPRLLFPYVRRIVGDMTTDGGFPQLNLDMIDFMALYRQEMERQQAVEGAARPS